MKITKTINPGGRKLSKSICIKSESADCALQEKKSKHKPNAQINSCERDFLPNSNITEAIHFQGYKVELISFAFFLCLSLKPNLVRNKKTQTSKTSAQKVISFRTRVSLFESKKETTIQQETAALPSLQRTLCHVCLV